MLARYSQSVRKLMGSGVGWADWWLNPNSEPSFIKLYASQRRSYIQALRSTGTAWGALWDWEDKMGVRRLAATAGIATPRLLAGPVPVENIPFEYLPNRFVVKPVLGSSRKGVYVLERAGNSYRDLLRAGREVTAKQIVSEMHEVANEGIIDSNQVIAEESLVDESGTPVYDWKVYAFQGTTPLILQIHRTREGRKARYYDGEWCDLGNVRRGEKANGDLPLPSDPVSLLNAAAKVSSALPVPFARIDLYEYRGRVLLGEITPMPGSGQRFSRPVDHTLGLAWEIAIARLMQRG